MIAPFLESLYRRHHRAERVRPDPLELAHGWARTEDAEVAALLAASLAYGRVAQILVSGRRLLGALGDEPSRTLRTATAAQLRSRLAGVYHRFNDAEDLALFCWLIGGALRAHGSLGAMFERAVAASLGGAREEDLQPALARFVAELAAEDAAPFVRGGRLPARHTVHYLLPRPDRGSACKRLFLFLRWMVRPADGVDLGLWTFAGADRLLIPVDTHILRLSRHLGLTERRDASLRTSREITAGLRAIDPADPVRFDFALTRLGILAECPSREQLAKCLTCELAPVCRRRAALLEERAAMAGLA